MGKWGLVCVSTKSEVERATLVSCLRNLEVCKVSRLLLPIPMGTKQDPKEPVLLMALMIMLHAKLCLSMIIILICVCWHP